MLRICQKLNFVTPPFPNVMLDYHLTIAAFLFLVLRMPKYHWPVMMEHLSHYGTFDTKQVLGRIWTCSTERTQVVTSDLPTLRHNVSSLA
jgi:hypothetical protein